MVKFLTLLAGLVVGVQSVEVVVSEPAARVELRLNSRVVAEASAPPWVMRCDFGQELHPGLVEVVAFDEEGRVVARDAQRINLPESPAEAAIVPTVDDSGRVVAAQLTWTSPEFERPRSISALLDERPVAVDRAYRIDLSAAAAGELHVLAVELEFSPELRLRRQLEYGRGFSGDASSALTAFPLLVDGSSQLPETELLTGWFTAGGDDLRVTAVERERGRLVVVRDPGAEDLLVRLQTERKRLAREARGSGTAPALDLLDDDVEMRVLVAEPVRPRDRARATLLFPYSKEGLPGGEGIIRAAVVPKNERLLGTGLMVGDAVAVAGLRAAEGNLRRAVLLLLGPQREDVSRFHPEAVRRFLDELHVPLVVWDLSGPTADAPPAWRPDVAIATFDDVATAAGQLRSLFRRQRVVWVAGDVLPQLVELGPAAEGIALVR
jgi:hypothetical protein